MSYREESGLVIRDHSYQRLISNKVVKEILDGAGTHLNDDGEHLFYWQYGVDVSDLESYLLDEAEIEDYIFIRLGEDDGDVTTVGCLWDNNFDMAVRREIAFIDNRISGIDKDTLKTLNSKPDAIKCYQCGHILKQPTLGIKFCPICES